MSKINGKVLVKFCTWSALVDRQNEVQLYINDFSDATVNYIFLKSIICSNQKFPNILCSFPICCVNTNYINLYFTINMVAV